MDAAGDADSTDHRHSGTVLVVDDNTDLAALTATYLERATQFETTTCDRGTATLEALDDGEPPACIVSDHEMPGMDGLELLAAVRESFPDLPFILFTGKGNEEIASEAISAGVTDYVRKGGPEQYDILANRVQNAVDRRQSEVALREEKDLLEQVLATTPGSIVCSRDGEIAYATARAAQTLGVDRNCLLGSSWLDPPDWTYTEYDGDPLTDAADPLDCVFEDGESVTDTPIAITRDEGERLYLSVDAAPLGDRGGDGTVDRAVVSFRDVTDQIEHQRQVAASEKKYQALVESLPDGVVLLEDGTGNVVEANDRAGELLGRERSALIGLHATDLHPAESADRYQRLYEDGVPRRAGAESTSRRFDDGSPIEVVTADGERIPIELRATVLELDDETFVHVLFRDRSHETERQRALERTQTVLDAVGDATYALDEDGVFTYANDAMAELVGRPVDDIVGSHSSENLSDTDYERATSLIQDLVEGDRDRDFIRLTMEPGDGDPRIVENHIALLPALPGEFRGTAGIARDITERAEQERRLRESEQKYATVVQEANDGVVIAQDGVLKFVNPRAGAILNADPVDLVGEPIASVVAEEDRDTVTDRLRRRLDGENPTRRYEFTALARDGEMVPIEFTASVITYEGAPAVLAICRDVSERKQRERELEQYETIVQTAPDGVFIIDEHANYVGGNIPGAELTGYSSDELWDMSVPDLVEEGVFGQEVISRYTDTVSHLLSSENEDEKGTFEFSITGDGESRVFECHVSLRPFDPEAGEEFRGSIGVLRDVTERKRRERDLERQNARLEKFADVVGHDLRNPLNVASGHLELGRDSGDPEAFDRVADAHDRMAEILDDLLTLARTGNAVEQTETVTLNDLAESAWGTVDTADATLELGHDLEFDADPGRVRQLLENLFANSVEHGRTATDAASAADSSQDGGSGPAPGFAGGHGEVTVTVGALPDESGFRVADDGPGIPASVRETAFDPGVTTRTDGTGFGLAIVSDIVEAHGWTVELGGADADTDTGTTIEVRFT